MEKAFNKPENPADSAKPETDLFQSLWSKICSAYEGTNVSRTIARLLHMYQADDGIFVYERLLRTVHVLLENYDVHGFRLLISMIPPPKDVPNSTIEKVFFDVAGCHRLNTPVYRFRSNTCNRVATTESPINLRALKNAPEPPVTLSPERSMDESCLPPKKRKRLLNIEPRNQTRNANSHPNCVKHNPECCRQHRIVENCKLMRNPLFLPAGAYQDFVIKPMGNKFVMVPLSQVCENSSIYKLQLKDEQEVSDNAAALNLEVRKGESRAPKSGENAMESRHFEGREKWNLREDIYKMDHVLSDNDQRQFVEKQEIQIDDLSARNNLKSSLRNFMIRIERNEQCNVPALPKMRPLPICWRTETKSAIAYEKTSSNVLKVNEIKENLPGYVPRKSVCKSPFCETLVGAQKAKVANSINHGGARYYLQRQHCFVTDPRLNSWTNQNRSFQAPQQAHGCSSRTKNPFPEQETSDPRRQKLEEIAGKLKEEQ